MKNYQQDGNTITIENTSTDIIRSGEPIAIGDIVVVAIVDIPLGSIGTAMARGVVVLPKLPTDNIAQGAAVSLKDGLIQLDDTDATAAGIAWEAAEATTDSVAVRLNG